MRFSKAAVTTFIILFILHHSVFSQVAPPPCTNLGQTPSSAFPVCGTSVFHQATVPVCTTADLPVPGCDGDPNAHYQNKNPYFYKFTCFVAGTLGFTITPAWPNEDYDWQFYDITNHDPEEIFTDPSLIVTGNWSATYGATGASSTGSPVLECGSIPSDNTNPFAQMPVLVAGHQYLLMVSHFSDTQSGYDLSFIGGTAVITDPLQPLMTSAKAACDGMSITVKLNKKMKCNSLTITGSEFSISPAGPAIVSAAGTNCSSAFDFDELVLTLAGPLANNNYQLTIKNGVDNNTILDYCNNSIPVNEQLSFTYFKPPPIFADSIGKPGCAPASVKVYFPKKIKCSTIAPDGSDFVVTGPIPVTVLSAGAPCVDGQSDTVIVNFTAPIYTKGDFQLHLKAGVDGSTIIDECGVELPAQQLPFSTADTVSARFDMIKTKNCQDYTLRFSHNGAHDVNYWAWTFNNTSHVNNQSYTLVALPATTNTMQLLVSNGVCTAVADSTIILADIPYTYPHLDSARVNCDGRTILVKLNKKMKCGSLTATGSEFNIIPAVLNIVSAIPVNCSPDQFFNEVLLTLATPLSNNNYRLSINNGNDNNTLIDSCDNSVPVNEELVFSYYLPHPVFADSIGKPGCTPSSLKIYFPRRISCSTIAPDGSDFTVTGPVPVTIQSAATNCVNGQTSIITINFTAPIYTKGDFLLHFKAGMDSIPPAYTCPIVLPLQQLPFSTADTVSPRYSMVTRFGCQWDTLQFIHDGAHDVNSWNWTFNHTVHASTISHTIVVPAQSTNLVQLTVSNGICKDSAQGTIVLDNMVTAGFEIPDVICREEALNVINTTRGNVDAWLWNFSAGITSTIKDPAPVYFPHTNNIETLYTIQLTAKNNAFNCTDTKQKVLRVLDNCFIAVPTAFTPNGDGLNDYLYPNNALKAENLEFSVFNRWGQCVFHSRNWQEKWDGTINGAPQPSGVFVWFLSYTHKDTGKKVFQKGTTTLIR